MYQYLRFEEVLPANATLETHPLNRLNNKKVQLSLGGLDAMDKTDSIVCLGKVVDPTEDAITRWLSQLKLMGYTFGGHMANTVILGDWKDIAQKVPCVKRVCQNKVYVTAELAYLRTKKPYSGLDAVWLYRGKDGDYFIWDEGRPDSWNSSNPRFRRHKFKSNLKHMVLFNPDSQWYQII